MERIGRYEVMEQIGEGGMGTVYKVCHPTLNRVMALKVLAKWLAKEEEMVERFLREAQVMANLKDHSYVVEVYDCGEVGGMYYYTMEYIPLSLSEYIGEGGVGSEQTRKRRYKKRALGVDESVSIIRDVLRGLDEIHGAGVIHRDISPQNVLLKELEGGRVRAKISDFGIAGVRGSGLTKTGEGGIGKEVYVAPEQWESLKDADERSDIYSVGVLFYRLVTGRLPIGRFKEPKEINKEVSSELNDVILRAFSQDPGDRFQSAGEMLKALDEALGVRSKVDGRGIVIKKRGGEWFRSRRWVLMGLMVIIVVSVVMAGLWKGRQDMGVKHAVSIRSGDSGNIKKPVKEIAKKSKLREKSKITKKYITIPSIGYEMVYIPPGEFMMGSPEDEEGRDSDEKLHKVRITRGFYMGVTEVTNGQFVKFLNDVKRRGDSGRPWFETKSEDSDSHIKGSIGNFYVENGYEDHPVIKVSWYGAMAFAEWLSRKTGHKFRLPTEAEWEYACRAGTNTRFYFGDDEKRLGDYAWYEENSDGKIHPVAQKLPNPWGLYDMLGNAYEWCLDIYTRRYPDTTMDDPVYIGRWVSIYREGYTNIYDGLKDKGADRVGRGGSWGNGPRFLRCADRGIDGPRLRYFDLGFRLLRMK